MLVFGLISLQLQTQPSKKKKKKKEKKKQSELRLEINRYFFGVGGRHGARVGFLKATRKVVETETNFL